MSEEVQPAPAFGRSSYVPRPKVLASTAGATVGAGVGVAWLAPGLTGLIGELLAGAGIALSAGALDTLQTVMLMLLAALGSFGAGYMKKEPTQ